MVNKKTCPNCQITFNATKTHFYKNKNSKDKLSFYCKGCNKIKRNEHYRKNPLMVHESNIKRLYGITYEEYLTMEKDQNHRCAICNLTLEEANCHNGRGKTKHFNIDHDHKTKKVRGLLCVRCNQGLGSFKHNKVFLENAIKYMREIT